MKRRGSSLLAVIRDFASRPYPLEQIQTPPLRVAREIEAALEFWNLPAPPGPIVEFGSGTGRLTKPLLERGYMVLAIEPDPRAQRGLSLLESAFSGQLHVFSKVTALPLGEFVPAAVGVDVLHHVRPAIILRQAANLVAPGGLIGFDEPDGTQPGWWVFAAVTGRLSNELGMIQAIRSRVIRALTDSGFTGVGVRRWAYDLRGKLGPRWFYAATKR